MTCSASSCELKSSKLSTRCSVRPESALLNSRSQWNSHPFSAEFATSISRRGSGRRRRHPCPSAGSGARTAVFSLEHIRRHLNDPLLDLDYLNLFLAGKPVDLSSARLYKLVQKRKIRFVDRRVLQQHFERGAACVLGGLDILEPEINALATALDRGRAATFSQRDGVFSQHGHEAYRGHVDTDDVLVIHMAGEKRGVSSAASAAAGESRRPRRRANGSGRRRGRHAPRRRALSAQLHAAPCRDALAIFAARLVRLVQSAGEHRGRAAAVAAALRSRFEPAGNTAARGSRQAPQAEPQPAYAADLAKAQAGEDAGHAEFRALLASNRVTFLDRLLQADRAPATTGPAATDRRT